MSGSSSGGSSAVPYGTVTVDPPPGFVLNFDGLEAIETLGRPFLLNLDVSSTTAKATVLSMLGSSVTIAFTGAGSTTRYYNGILTRVIYAGLAGGAARYHMELRPWLWLLSRTQDCKIFQNQSPFAIIQSIFSTAGFSSYVKDNRINQSGSTVLEYCVQYRETSMDFVTRLMETYGIYYYFTHENGKHTLNFCDDPNSHTALSAAIPYQRDMTEIRNVASHIWEFSADMRLQPGIFTHTDYNFTTPSANLLVKSQQAGAHKYGTQEIYDYPGLYGVAADGTTLANVRIQDLVSRRQIYEGATNARDLVIGCKFTLSQAMDKDKALNGEYMVTATTSHFGQGESKSSSTDQGQLTDSYSCTFHSIPGTTNFRLERQTPLPMVRGPQTAKVVGNSGDEITVDQYGRIKVHFYWDRVNPEDQTASCWIRVSQNWAGAGWGSMVIPRIGQEVIVEFLEGNPDRPIVTGCVYNASQTVPYPLPANATRSSMKSNSSKGGGGSNEIRFEDKKGSEEVFFQAQYDYNKVVLNNETSTVTQDVTHVVKQGNRATTIQQGNETLTVSQGKRSVTVSTGDNALTVSTGNNSTTVSTGNESLTVSTGNHSITVSVGSSTISATQGITLSCGPCSIALTPSGITISGPQISVNADATLSMQGGAEATLQGGVVMIN